MQRAQSPSLDATIQLRADSAQFISRMTRRPIRAPQAPAQRAVVERLSLAPPRVHGGLVEQGLAIGELEAEYGRQRVWLADAMFDGPAMAKARIGTRSTEPCKQAGTS